VEKVLLIKKTSAEEDLVNKTATETTEPTNAYDTDMIHMIHEDVDTKELTEEQLSVSSDQYLPGPEEAGIPDEMNEITKEAESFVDIAAPEENEGVKQINDIKADEDADYDELTDHEKNLLMEISEQLSEGADENLPEPQDTGIAEEINDPIEMKDDKEMDYQMMK